MSAAPAPGEGRGRFASPRRVIANWKITHRQVPIGPVQVRWTRRLFERVMKSTGRRGLPPVMREAWRQHAGHTIPARAAVDTITWITLPRFGGGPRRGRRHRAAVGHELSMFVGWCATRPATQINRERESDRHRASASPVRP